MNNVVELSHNQQSTLPAAEAGDLAPIWRPPCERAMRAAAAVFGVTQEQLVGLNRCERFLVARAATAWAARQLCVSYRTLSGAMRRDDSSLSQLVIRTEGRRQADPHFARCCDEVLRRAKEGG